MLKDLATAATGGLVSFGGDNYMMEDQQAFNAKQAQYNRDFQERMANTAYQRAAKDLDKAGLNRILALGSPAATPGGSMAQSGILPAGSSAVQAGASLMNATTGASSAKQNIAESKSRQKFIAANVEKAEYEMEQLFSRSTLNTELAANARLDNELKKHQISKEEIVKSLYRVAEPYVKELEKQARNGQLDIDPAELVKTLTSSVRTLVNGAQTLSNLREDFTGWLGGLYDRLQSSGNRPPSGE